MLGFYPPPEERLHLKTYTIRAGPSSVCPMNNCQVTSTKNYTIVQKKIPLLQRYFYTPTVLLSPIARVLFLAFCIFVCPFFVPVTLQAQHLVEGVVRDAASGEPLPAANVQIDGTYTGTITNIDGQFSLQVPSLPAVLVVRYIGYESQYVDVTTSASTGLQIQMPPTVYTLEELVVSEKDPAVDIMREVIEKKKAWRAELASYSAEAYNRFTLKNDTGIVSIIESFTDTYWNPVDGTREVVKARRQTNNLDIGNVLPAAQFVANLYDDNIDIAGYNFMGITHPDALDHYTFELLGYRRIDDDVVYDIGVSPRNRLKTGFVGKVAVLDVEYALLEVELEPGDAFLFPPPIEAFDVTFAQQFSNFGGSAWLPVDFRSNMTAEIGLNRLLSFPTFFIEQVSRISNYDVNAIVPDTLFAEGSSVVVDSVSVAEDTLLDQEGIAVPLDKAEAAAYVAIDSTMTLAKAYEPTGPLARVVKVTARDDDSGDEVVLAGEEGSRQRRRLNLDFSPHIRFNRVEGVYGELGIGKRFSNRFNLEGAIGVSSALRGDDKLAFSIGTQIRLDPARRLRLDVSYAEYTDTQTHSSPFLRTVNGLVVLFDGVDYYDYFLNERLRASLSYAVPETQLTLRTGLHIESQGDLSKQTDYDFFGGSFTQRENPDINSFGGVHSFVAGFSFGDSEETLGVTGRRFLDVHVEHALPGLDSDHAFTRYNASLEWRFNTFFTRRLLPNTLDVKVVGQRGFGDLPVTRFGAVDGRMTFYNQFGTLKTLQSKPYRGDDALGIFWEHNFKTVPFEILGMRRAAENAINLIVFGGHARTWQSSPVLQPSLVRSSDGWHQEVGVSVSGLFSLFRVDFATRLDAPGFTVGLGSARIF